MGVMQRSMVRACPHVWFERSEMKDRHAVTSRYDMTAGKTVVNVLDICGTRSPLAGSCPSRTGSRQPWLRGSI